jgi:hypothetical protein
MYTKSKEFMGKKFTVSQKEFLAFVFLFFLFLLIFWHQNTNAASSVEGGEEISEMNCICKGSMQERKKVNGGYLSKVTAMGGKFVLIKSLVDGKPHVLDCDPGECVGTSPGAKYVEEAKNFKKDNDFCGNKLTKAGGQTLCKISGEPVPSTEEAQDKTEFAKDKDFKGLQHDDFSKPSRSPAMKQGTPERQEFEKTYCQYFPASCKLY